jgi:predicted DNA-binding antitoxin AbrB/MazE fold protein
MANLRIHAIYEDGVLKPSEPLNLSEHQEVLVSVKTVTEPTNIVQLEGVWATDQADMSDKEIEAILNDAKQTSLKRLLNQIDGRFKE